ncbi:hypothetical protein JRQ81_015781 [Phrynocephalus forsythii]|uniref:Dol-P-Glc:Glc(2)Man(9)GlcNAc(2)-PP-Dol alpha-1,2-glucosyltransferase n=1 Tax=Phrynocephalus forsythii TaxID=171643 RepID=A0A9Q0XX79_9SAUR|nr:hypothetical protein JRQ81_015781 [Phrynocephalus forsythii]
MPSLSIPQIKCRPAAAYFDRKGPPPPCLQRLPRAAPPPLPPPPPPPGLGGRRAPLAPAAAPGTMERSEAYYFSAAFSCAFLVSCLLFSAVNRQQRSPYMDEAFHVPQAQAYCEGRFQQWDPMITTLPGLYLVSVGIVKPAAWLFGWSGSVVCSTGMLRFINLLFTIGNVYLLYLLFCRIHHKKAVSGFQRILSTLAVTIFPVLYFFTFLYYTDTGSAFFTLFAYLMCLYGNHKTSALLGFCGFMFRQTNIVWMVFCGGSVIAQKLNESWKTELSKSKDQKSLPAKGSFAELTRVFRFLVEYLSSLKNLSTLILLTWPYIGMVLAFFTFVALNGGIVVGDRSSHEACLHFPQLFYFLSFALSFSFPLIVTPSKVVSFLRSVRTHLLQYTIITIVCCSSSGSLRMHISICLQITDITHFICGEKSSRNMSL